VPSPTIQAKECAGHCQTNFSVCNIFIHDSVTNSCFLGKVGTSFNVIATQSDADGFIDIGKTFCLIHYIVQKERGGRETANIFILDSVMNSCFLGKVGMSFNVIATQSDADGFIDFVKTFSFIHYFVQREREGGRGRKETEREIDGGERDN
jgi:hypothetical protein